MVQTSFALAHFWTDFDETLVVYPSTLGLQTLPYSAWSETLWYALQVISQECHKDCEKEYQFNTHKCNIVTGSSQRKKKNLWLSKSRRRAWVYWTGTPSFNPYGTLVKLPVVISISKSSNINGR